MPSNIKIDAEKLLRKLKTLQELAPVTGALLAAGVHVAGKFSEYPPQSGLTRKQVYGQSFQSERQRRWFFAALKRGEIEVPYRRGSSPGSRNLKQTWTVRQVSPLVVEVGTNTPYAPYVQSSESQSRYHSMTGWRTDKDIMESERELIVGYVWKEIRRQLEA